MRYETKLGCLVLCVAVVLGGCSSGPEPRDRPAAEPASPSPEIERAPVTEAPATPPPRQPDRPSPAAPSPVAPASGESAPEVPPAPTSPPPPAPDAEPDVVDAGGVIEVAATKPGLSRIGAEKCKLCHKVQFASWAETAHATRTPPLDCEGCHGPGSEYKSLAVMKDPEKARAAGLVSPDRSFCSTCHRSGWTDDLLTRAHAHKAEAS